MATLIDMIFPMLTAQEIAAERWLPMKRHESTYEVSNLGRVRSLSRRLIKKDGRPYSVKSRDRRGTLVSGYPAVLVKENGAQYCVSCHVAVLRTFVGEPAPGEESRHLDGNRRNPRLGNLAWSSHLVNMHDQDRHGTKLKGESHPNSILTEMQVLSIRARTDLGEPARAVAKSLGLGASTVKRIRNGQSWTHILNPRQTKE